MSAIEQTWRKLGSLLATLWRVSPFLFLFNAMFYCIQACLPLATMYITKLVLDVIADIIQQRASYEDGIWLLLLQVIVGLAAFAAGTVQQILNKRLNQKISFYYQKELLNKSVKISFTYFDDHATYETINRARSTAGEAFSICMTLFEIAKNAITITGYLVLLISIHWMLPIAMVLLTIPSLYLHLKIGTKRYGQFVNQTPVERRVSYLYHTLLGRDVAKEVRVFGHDQYLMDRWGQLYWKNADEQYQLEKKAGGIHLVINSIRDVSSAIFIAGLLWFTTKGSLSIGDYYMFSQGITFSLGLVNTIADSLARVRTSSLFFSDFYAFMNYQEEAAAASDHSKVPAPGDHHILADQICFAYPNRSEFVLRNISFQIQAGEKVAIVGSNGAGKSTLVKCLLGLYPVTSGNIYLDSVCLRDIDRRLLQRKFSVIFQDFVQYYLTVRENIAVGDIHRIQDEYAMRKASETSGADKVISKLPNGWDTEVGIGYLGGQELSGGQWQKIALSRALIKDADIIILDEPTAALDPVAEADLLEKFIDMAQDKTAIFITHRLGSCKKVDRILVLKDGELVEEGNHEELMRRNGEYARMFQAQAQWYV